MSELKISVIIPTYNRIDILKKSLSHYEKQTLPLTDFEILVIDDGSIDNTSSLILKVIQDSDLSIKFLQQNHKGANAARNQGIHHADGKLLLFTGDDILPTPDFLVQHISFHKKQQYFENLAVLGFTTWSPDIKISSLMKYLEECRYLPQFEYSKITNPTDLPHEYFYTSNISIHREFLLKYGTFDEDMNKPFADDGELAYRLKNHGLKIIYNPDAKAYHWHVIKLEQLYRRAKTAGEMCYLFWQKHPELGTFPPSRPEYRFKQWLKTINISKEKSLLERAERNNSSYSGNPLLESAYQKVMTKYYQQGVREGIRAYGRIPNS